ncbi:hypothetical protein NQ317_011275 [Molorchus minor]|uniref:Uncharacterized protein n=1 Tax=Molorchus minor TaxID=1323400 RepID=A0ABQ9JSU9_9CUCU|nr:hypothetical protein NQ317_011275 [Molorchus minor]
MYRYYNPQNYRTQEKTITENLPTGKLDLQVVPDSPKNQYRYDFYLTGLQLNKQIEDSLTQTPLSPWSNSDNNITCKSPFKESTNKLLHINQRIHRSDFTEHSSRTVIKPPTMFEKNAITKKRMLTINSINREGGSSIQINPRDLKKNSDMRRCISTQYLQMGKGQRCCMEYCHSPRSSDSGMAGSCPLNSNVLGNTNDLPSCSAQERL